ncbi:hypothetical protein ACUXIR_001524, partial [Staphylococcus hominis]
NQKNYKKDNFYIISIEIVFFHLFRNFMSQTLIIYYMVVDLCNPFNTKVERTIQKAPPMIPAITSVG